MIFIAVFSLTLAMMFIFRISLEEATAKKITEKKIENVQSQCAILANQIMSNRFMIDNSNDNINAEIDQLANVYEGRIMIVDSNYQVVKDTYTIEQGKYMLFEDVFLVMNQKLDKKINSNVDGYTEIIVPIIAFENDKVQGVMIATVSMEEVL